MNKIINFSILYAGLFFVEILIIFISLVLIDLPQYGIDLFFIKKAWYGTGLWSIWRACYYGIPFVIIFFLFFKYMNHLDISYKPFLFSIFNAVIFVILNFLYKYFDLPNLEFTNNLFWITCVAIFVSPLIIGQIPYFRRLIERL
jgi:hypothetical protein